MIRKTEYMKRGCITTAINFNKTHVSPKTATDQSQSLSAKPRNSESGIRRPGRTDVGYIPRLEVFS